MYQSAQLFILGSHSLQNMGHIKGLTTLIKFELNKKKVYVFYRALNKKTNPIKPPQAFP
jgi:hypothetical protein